MKKKIALIALVLFSVVTFMPAVASVDVEPDKKKTTVVVEKENDKSGCNGCAHKCGDAAKKSPCSDKSTKTSEGCDSKKEAKTSDCKTKKSSCCDSKTKKQ